MRCTLWALAATAPVYFFSLNLFWVGSRLGGQKISRSCSPRKNAPPESSAYHASLCTPSQPFLLYRLLVLAALSKDSTKPASPPQNLNRARTSVSPRETRETDAWMRRPSSPSENAHQVAAQRDKDTIPHPQQPAAAQWQPGEKSCRIQIFII